MPPGQQRYERDQRDEKEPGIPGNLSPDRPCPCQDRTGAQRTEKGVGGLRITNMLLPVYARPLTDQRQIGKPSRRGKSGLLDLLEPDHRCLRLLCQRNGSQRQWADHQKCRDQRKASRNQICPIWRPPYGTVIERPFGNGDNYGPGERRQNLKAVHNDSKMTTRVRPI